MEVPLILYGSSKVSHPQDSKKLAEQPLTLSYVTVAQQICGNGEGCTHITVSRSKWQSKLHEILGRADDAQSSSNPFVFYKHCTKRIRTATNETDHEVRLILHMESNTCELN
jgi:hypothetical protein